MRGCRYQSHLLQVQTMIFDIELHCDKWMDCKTKWCNGDGGFWCKEDCKLLQVNSPSNRKKVEKILSNWRCGVHPVCRWNMEKEGEEMSRLIDADKLLEELREYHPLSLSYGILSDIEYFPTAYDIDKVVEQLEELKEAAYESYGLVSGAYVAVCNAIEIVKGGVEE